MVVRRGLKRRSEGSQTFLQCRVEMADLSVLPLQIPRSSLGVELLSSVFSLLGFSTSECWSSLQGHFGLQTRSSEGLTRWLSLDRRVKQQSGDCGSGVHYFLLRLQFYPLEKWHRPLDQHEVECRHMFLIVKDDLDQGRLLPHDEQHEEQHDEQHQHLRAHLHALALQGERGDYDEHNETTANLDSHIIDYYQSLRGVPSHSARLGFLRLAAQLDLYGVEVYDVQGIDGSEYALALAPKGVLVFEKRRKIGHFQWSSIAKVSFRRCRITLRVLDTTTDSCSTNNEKRRKAYTFVFRSRDELQCKELWRRTVAQHTFYYFGKNNEEKEHYHHYNIQQIFGQEAKRKQVNLPSGLRRTWRRSRSRGPGNTTTASGKTFRASEGGKRLQHTWPRGHTIMASNTTTNTITTTTTNTTTSTSIVSSTTTTTNTAGQCDNGPEDIDDYNYLKWVSELRRPSPPHDDQRVPRENVRPQTESPDSGCFVSSQGASTSLSSVNVDRCLESSRLQRAKSTSDISSTLRTTSVETLTKHNASTRPMTTSEATIEKTVTTLVSTNTMTKPIIKTKTLKDQVEKLPPPRPPPPTTTTTTTTPASSSTSTSASARKLYDCCVTNWEVRRQREPEYANVAKMFFASTDCIIAIYTRDAFKDNYWKLKRTK